MHDTKKSVPISYSNGFLMPGDDCNRTDPEIRGASAALEYSSVTVRGTCPMLGGVLMLACLIVGFQRAKTAPPAWPPAVPAAWPPAAAADTSAAAAAARAMASRAARAPSKPVIVQLQPDSLVLLWQPRISLVPLVHARGPTGRHSMAPLALASPSPKAQNPMLRRVILLHLVDGQ